MLTSWEGEGTLREIFTDGCANAGEMLPSPPNNIGHSLDLLYHCIMRLSFALLLAFWLAVAPGIAGADTVIDSAMALAGVKAGEMTLIDVRSPDEWRKTGVPQGAKTVTIHDPDGMAGFVAAATRAVNGKKDRRIALICARGLRSYRAANALRDAGFTNILNVREGMLGNPLDGPGWLDRKLPVERCKNC